MAFKRPRARFNSVWPSGKVPLPVRAVVFLVLLSSMPVLAQSAPLTLDQIIDRARSGDLRVRDAEAQLRWFRAKYDEARWAWFPKIEATAMVAGPTPEARNNGLGGPPTTEASLQYDLNFGTPGVMFRTEAQGVLPIYTFGKLGALEQAAARGVDVGRALKLRAQDEAEYQAAQAYYLYQLSRDAAADVKATLESLDEAARMIQKLRDQRSEQVTQSDVYKVQFVRKQIEARLAATDAGARLTLEAIRLLIVGPPGAPLEIVREPLPSPTGTLQPVEEYVELALSHRPELKALEAGMAAREREVFIYERMMYPDFGIAGFARWQWTTSATRQISPFAYDPYNDLSAGVGLVMRYSFDIPQKLARTEAARAELERLGRQQELAMRGVRLEVERAWWDLKDALTRAQAQSEAERVARRWATAAFAAFDLGTTDTRDLIEAVGSLGFSSLERSRAWADVQVGFRNLSRTVGTRVTAVPLAPTESPALPPPTLLP